MAGLARTDLTTSQKVNLSVLAAAGKGHYGAMSRLAEDFQLSRPTVYTTAAEAKETLAKHFEKGEPRFHGVTVCVDEAQLRRVIIGLRCHGPNSIRTIENLLPILYPGVRLSYGKIQSVCAEAEAKAAEFNANADLTGISAGALDEMFSQGDPVLAGVDLDTGYLFGLDLRDSRNADDWAQMLRGANDRFDQFEQAIHQADEAMEYIDLNTAELRSAEEMKSYIVAAGQKMMAIGGEKCRKVGKYICNRADGLVLYMQELVEHLEALFPRHGEKEVRLACDIWRLFRDLKHHRWPWERNDDEKLLVRCVHRLRELAGNRADSVLLDVDVLLQRRHRASSAIEGFNAALRPHLYVHKGVTSGFLELFRAYYNLRTRRWGRHKGTSAHQLLRGDVVYDWLTVLGYPPSKALS